MIDAKKAKDLTEKYYESQTDVDMYLAEIDKLIREAAQKGRTCIVYDFKKWDLSVAEITYANRKVKEALKDYGYTIINDLFSIEICW